MHHRWVQLSYIARASYTGIDGLENRPVTELADIEAALQVILEREARAMRTS